MPDTALIGGPDSQPGNIIPGLGAGAAIFPFQVTAPFAKGAVGEIYDIAVGVPSGDGSVHMVGYVTAPQGQFQLSTDLQDEQHLVQVSSPSSSDRFTRYPRASQGDWSKGEGQLIFVDPAKFYYARNLDPTKPGQLQLLPSVNPILTLTAGGSIPDDTGIYHQSALGSDGKNWVLSTLDSGGHNLLQNVGATSTLSMATIGNGSEVTGAIGAGGYMFCATQNGIWRWAAASAGTQSTSDVPWQHANPNLAYFKGSLYYPFGTNHNQLWSVAVDAGAVAGAQVAAWTSATAGTAVPEGVITCVASTASGIFVALGGYDYTGLTGISYLYTFDGTTAARVADLQGMVKTAYEMNGITYVLAEQQQAQYTSQPGGLNGVTPNLHQFTLFSLSGSTLSVIQDFRLSTSDFQNGGTLDNIARASLSGDGHIIYIGFPGYGRIIGYDPTDGAFFNAADPLGVGPAAGTTGSIRALRALPLSPGGLLMVQRSTTGQRINQFNLANVTPGTIYTSFFDFGTPTVVKSFDGLEIDLAAPLPVGASMSAAYRTDLNQVFQPATLLAQANAQLVALCAADTLGYRIQWQLTFTPRSGVSGPLLASYSVKANLGRVWTVTVACRHNQRVRTGDGNDPQGLTGQALLANLENGYRQGGYVTLWVPDATTAEPYVSQVQAYIEELQKSNAPGINPGYAVQEDGTRDFSCDVQLTLVEAL